MSGCPPELPLYRLASGDTRGIASRISCGQDIAADGCFSLGMLAEFERPLTEHGAWVYPRLFWECGMIGQVLYLEAEAAGLRGTGIGCFFDDGMHSLLGLKDRRYQSLYHFTVGGPLEDERLTTLPAYVREACSVKREERFVVRFIRKNLSWHWHVSRTHSSAYHGITSQALARITNHVARSTDRLNP